MIVAAKFLDGAWIVVLAVPATIALLSVIHRYYSDLDHRLALSGRFTLDEWRR